MKLCDNQALLREVSDLVWGAKNPRIGAGVVTTAQDILDAVDRHLAALPSGSAGLTRFSWLIERKATPAYLGTWERVREFAWTADHGKALAFATKEQAEGAMLAIRGLAPKLFAADVDCRPVEHGWFTSAPPGSAVAGAKPKHDIRTCQCAPCSALRYAAEQRGLARADLEGESHVGAGWGGPAPAAPPDSAAKGPPDAT